MKTDHSMTSDGLTREHGGCWLPFSATDRGRSTIHVEPYFDIAQYDAVGHLSGRNGQHDSRRDHAFGVGAPLHAVEHASGELTFGLTFAAPASVALVPNNASWIGSPGEGEVSPVLSNVAIEPLSLSAGILTSPSPRDPI